MARRMKRIAIIISAIFLIIIIALVVFALTFDINKYRGIIEERISIATGKDIELGSISLDFSHGLGCRVQGLALKEKSMAWDEAWLKAKAVDISLQILPLLKKDLQIDRLEIKGMDVSWSQELSDQAQKTKAPSEKNQNIGPGELAALKFLARQIVISDSRVNYLPGKSAAPIKLSISNIIMDNVSLYGPVRVSASLSATDKSEDNIVLKGILFPELSSKEPYAKDFYLKVDLGKVDAPGILAALGYTEQAKIFLNKHLSGVVSINAEKLFLNPDRILDSKISINMSGIETDVAPFKGGIKGLRLDASLTGKDLTVSNFSGNIAGGDVTASLLIKDLDSLINKKSLQAIENLKISAVLTRLDIKGIASLLNNEDLNKLLSEKEFSGKVSLDSGRIYLDPEKIWDSDISILLDKFTADIKEIPGGIRDMDLDASFKAGDLNIKKLSAVIFGTDFTANGVVKGLKDFGKDKRLPELQDFSCQVDLARIDSQSFLKAIGKSDLAKTIQGKTFKGKAVFKGKDLFTAPSDIFKSDASISIAGFGTDIFMGDKGGIKDLYIEARLGHGSIFVDKLSGIAAGGRITGSGTIKDIQGVISNKTGINAEDIFLQFNLEDFDIPGLAEFFGNKDINRALKGKSIAGKVTVKSDSILLGQKQGLAGVSVLLSQGATDLIPIQGGVKDIEMDAVLEGRDLDLRKFDCALGSGTFSIKGTIKDVFSGRFSSLNILAKGVDLDKALLQSAPGLPRFHGILDLDADVKAQGFQPEELMQSLSGSGSFKVDGPVLKDMNILRAAFSKMDMIPGLVAKLKENLPQSYEEVLKQNDTKFKPIASSYTISQGNVIFKELNVESEGFVVKSRGGFGLTGDMKLDSQLYIMPDLSGAFIKIVRELKYLADEKGEINMPLKITGKAPQVSVDIDREYVLKKLLVSKGTELLGDILSGKGRSSQEPQGEQQGQPAEPQQEKRDIDTQQQKDSQPTPAGILKSIFDAIGSQD